MPNAFIKLEVKFSDNGLNVKATHFSALRISRQMYSVQGATFLPVALTSNQCAANFGVTFFSLTICPSSITTRSTPYTTPRPELDLSTSATLHAIPRLNRTAHTVWDYIPAPPSSRNNHNRQGGGTHTPAGTRAHSPDTTTMPSR